MSQLDLSDCTNLTRMANQTATTTADIPTASGKVDMVQTISLDREIELDDVPGTPTQDEQNHQLGVIEDSVPVREMAHFTAISALTSPSTALHNVQMGVDYTADRNASNYMKRHSQQEPECPSAAKQRAVSAIPRPPILQPKEGQASLVATPHEQVEVATLLREMESRIRQDLQEVKRAVRDVSDEVDCLKEYNYALTASLTAVVTEASERLEACMAAGLKPTQAAKDIILNLASEMMK